VLVVCGAGFEAAVQDADEPVVADVGASTVFFLPEARVIGLSALRQWPALVRGGAAMRWW